MGGKNQDEKSDGRLGEGGVDDRTLRFFNMRDK